jgi:hypothetical protein
MCVRLLWLCGLDVASDPLIVRGVHRFLDNGSDQGTAWTAAAFDDSAWASGVGQVRVVLATSCCGNLCVRCSHAFVELHIPTSPHPT